MPRKKKYEDISDLFDPLDMTIDELFRLLMNNPQARLEALRILTGKPDLEILEAFTQKKLKNLMGRSLILDFICRDTTGRIINVEMQKSDNQDHFHRVRFHKALIDACNLKKYAKFGELPNVCVIYITDFDLIGNGKTLNHVYPTVLETGEIIDDGTEEIYASTVNFDGSAAGALMAAIKHNRFDDRVPQVSNFITYLKTTEEGRTMVNEAIVKRDQLMMEKGREEGREEGFAKGEAKGFAKGEAKGREKTSVEFIRTIMEVTGKTIEEAMEYLKIPLTQRPRLGKLVLSL